MIRPCQSPNRCWRLQENVEATVTTLGKNDHKVVQWNAAWIADSWAEFVLPGMGGSAAYFNRFFLGQMDTYFKKALGEQTYDAMPDSTDAAIPKGWTVFYALAKACSKQDQAFSERSHFVDICKARNDDEFRESLSKVPPISGHTPSSGRKDNIKEATGDNDADARKLQLYYGAHKYVCNMLTDDKGAQDFLNQMV